ncbi:hypothetical protein QL996_04590 [Planococcus sp. APC 4015]|nr:hypothetical protein [Planococcus sp. APC 4015]
MRQTERSPSPSRAAASPVWLITGILALVASVVIAVIVAVAFSAPIALIGIAVPLATAGSFWMSLIGYLLTPIVVMVLYGLDNVSQRNGLRANRNFDIRPEWTRVLLWLAVASMIVGVWHALNMSVPISEWIL